MASALFEISTRTQTSLALAGAGALGLVIIGSGSGTSRASGEQAIIPSSPATVSDPLPELKLVPSPLHSAVVAELNAVAESMPVAQPSPSLLRALDEPAQPAMATYEFLPNTQYYKRLRHFMVKHEGLRCTAYDCTADAKTIGIGFNIDANRTLMKKTLGVDDRFVDNVASGRTEMNDAQIEALFAASIRAAENVCRRKIKNFDQLSQGRQIALTSLAFNAPALIGPKITLAVTRGKWNDAFKEIKHNSGAVNNGLRNRRADEAKIFQINADGYFRHIDPPDLPYHSGDEHSHAPVRSVGIEEVKIKYAWLGVQPKLRLDNTPPMAELVAVQPTNQDSLAKLVRVKSLVAGRVA